MTGGAPAERRGGARAVLQVAHQRFGTDQELVGQYGPGADQQASFPHQLLDARSALGTDLEVVVDHTRLAVQREVEVVGVGLEQVEERVNQVDELDAELLERQVPLSVPVRVRNEVEGAHAHIISAGDAQPAYG